MTPRRDLTFPNVPEHEIRNTGQAGRWVTRGKA